ncbi:hypothetical protein HHL21_14460 [Massilia sp. RP-1-19]|uniref:Uncharacterized protein n=1 Tax=Massilia polaris TaxID=2728846 RepID=A0A848HK75_9BURK|nr:hypothetical protein [Massilia polaris]NML62256.1 hypothetical protein [Massilia polaris]
MRDQMPVVAAWIDDLRHTFGTEYIDRIIKEGVRGKPVFFASENGHTVGTAVPVGTRVLRDERGNRTVVMDGNGQRINDIDGADRRGKLKGMK